jgi:small-conductance mechanosensitive channel
MNADVFETMTIAQENADLKTQLQAASVGTDQAAGEVVALKSQVSQLDAAQAGLLEKCGLLEAELSEAKANQADVAELAGAQAAEIVARQGADPVAEVAEEVSKSKTVDELWNDYSAISDLKERTLFYRNEIKPQL